MPDLITVREAAELLACSRDTVERMIRRGDLRATDLNPGGQRRSLRVDVEEIKRLTARNA